MHTSKRSSLFNSKNPDFLYDAVQTGDSYEVKELLKEGWNDTEWMGVALCNAVNAGHLDIINILLQNKADIHVSWNGFKPIHSAATFGQCDVIKLLLKYKCPVDLLATSHCNRTALHCAATWDHHAIIEVLLQSEANINAVDSMGSTPLELAVTKSNLATVSILLQNRACSCAINMVGLFHEHRDTTGNMVTSKKCRDCNSTSKLLQLSNHQLDKIVLYSIHQYATQTSQALSEVLSYFQIITKTVQTNELTYNSLIRHLKSHLLRFSIHNLIVDMKKINEDLAHGVKMQYIACIQSIHNLVQKEPFKSMTDLSIHLEQQWKVPRTLRSIPLADYIITNALISPDRADVLVPYINIDAMSEFVKLVPYKRAEDQNEILYAPLKTFDALMKPLTQQHRIAPTGNPTEKQLLGIARVLGHRWKDLAVELGLPYHSTENYERAWPTNPIQQNMAMLMDWRVEDENLPEKERCARLNNGLISIGKCDLTI